MLRMALVSLVVVISGCVPLSYQKIPEDTQRIFNYEYVIPAGTKAKNLQAARAALAELFNDSNRVTRHVDEEAGTIIGKAIINWPLGSSYDCWHEYTFRFATVDEKARLQIEIYWQVPSGSRCIGWPRPGVTGYQHIVQTFNDVSKGLDDALHGKGATADFMRFD